MENAKQVEEVASIFNVHFRTVYLWIRQKRIKAIRIGKRYYIPNEEVERIKKEGI